jgi:surface polysaccharide O-acyltransferase-like enzyme
MFLIVAGHSVVHGGFDELPLNVNGLLATALTQGSRIGVDVFVFLSGYFSVGREISKRKLKSQYLQIWLYSAIITVSMVLIGVIPFSLKVIRSVLFPIATSQYWFATCYVLLMLATPILQVAIKGMQKRQFQMLLLTFGILWSVFPTLLIGAPGYCNFGWFIFVYMLAAYSRIYMIQFTSKIKIWHGVAGLIFVCLSTIIVYYVGV